MVDPIQKNTLPDGPVVNADQGLDVLVEEYFRGPQWRSTEPLDRIAEANFIGTDVLERLTTGELWAVRIPNFIKPELANRLADAFLDPLLRTNYFHEIKHQDGSIEYVDYNVDRIGFPRNLLYGCDDVERFRRYFEENKKVAELLNEVSNPDYSPMLYLIRELSYAWPYGARPDRIEPPDNFDKVLLNLAERMCTEELIDDYKIETEFGRLIMKPFQAHVGIGRITRPGEITNLSEKPHTDGLPPELAYQQQFGANIYLRMPEEGGELVLWDRDSSGNLEEVARITPKPYDLIILNSGKLHSVCGFKEGAGERVTLSTFIGYRDGQRLRLWS